MSSDNDHQCGCCMKMVKKERSRTQSSKIKDIFFRFLGFKLPDNLICTTCNFNLLTFDAFQREIRRKHTSAGSSPEKVTVKRKHEEQDCENEKAAKSPKCDVEEDSSRLIIDETQKLSQVLETTPKPRLSSSSHNKVNPSTAESLLKAETPEFSTLEAIQVARKMLNLPSSNSFKSTKSAKSAKIENKELNKEEPKAKSLREEILGNLQIVLATTEEEAKSSDPVDDDEVIILPPEPPIDVDTFSELPKAPKDTSSLFKCEHCNAVSPKMEIIVEHTKLMHSYACERKCGLVFSTFEIMLDHVRRVHERKRKQTHQTMALEENLNFQLRAKPRGRPWGNRQSLGELIEEDKLVVLQNKIKKIN